MKLVTFIHENRAQSGVLEGESILPLEQAGIQPGIKDMLSLIAGGDVLLSKAREIARNSQALRLPVGSVRMLAPLINPPRIFGIGLNYLAHAVESKKAVQSVPTVFLKLSSSIVGPGGAVLLPPEATQPDYEAELAVVIGKPGHRIAAENWREHVFGYTIVNDVSARGVQLATTQWTLGKSFPTFTPMGPVIVTADEIPEPHELDIRLTLEGEVMQSANTRDMIFRVPELIAHLSGIVALEPGDIISTGTPAGVGMGRTPQRWLKPDEEMVIEIEKIGTLRNRTRASA